MLNFKIYKYILLSIILIPGLFFLAMLFGSLNDKPKIVDIDNIQIIYIISDNVIEDNQDIVLNNQIDNNFSYELIGIRYGNKNSSVIVKKANNEYLIAVGEMLDNGFELIEVTKDSAVFRNGQKVYKITKNEKN